MTFIEDLREAANRRSDEHTCVRLCPNDVHLRAARAWRAACDRCGQSIPTGNVGLSTWCDHQRCEIGAYNHQHGCGELNFPTEVTVNVADLDPDQDPDEVIDELLATLDEQVREEMNSECDTVLERLRRDLADARRELDAAGPLPSDPDERREVLDSLGILDEAQAETAWDGVFVDDSGRLCAFAPDPSSLDIHTGALADFLEVHEDEATVAAAR